MLQAEHVRPPTRAQAANLRGGEHEIQRAGIWKAAQALPSVLEPAITGIPQRRGGGRRKAMPPRGARRLGRGREIVAGDPFWASREFPGPELGSCPSPPRDLDPDWVSETTLLLPLLGRFPRSRKRSTPTGTRMKRPLQGPLCFQLFVGLRAG